MKTLGENVTRSPWPRSRTRPASATSSSRGAPTTWCASAALSMARSLGAGRGSPDRRSCSAVGGFVDEPDDAVGGNPRRGQVFTGLHPLERVALLLARHREDGERRGVD